MQVLHTLLRLTAWPLLASLLLGGGLAQAQTPSSATVPRSIQVVVHPDFRNAFMTRGELAALFMRTRTTLADGSAVQVIDSADAVLREQFYQTLVGRSAVQMHAYWSRMVFSGAGRPPPQMDSAAVINQLRSDTNTIAYVSAVGQELRGVKVLMVLDVR